MTSAIGYAVASSVALAAAIWAASRAFRWPATLLWHGLPVALAVGVHPRPASALVPIAGPWAGERFGHHGCTMATASPILSVVALGVGAILLVTLAARPANRVARLAIVPWWLAWAFFAGLLSELNTLS
jgi:hypothetical protein